MLRRGKKIALPLVPSWKEFHEHYDTTGLPAYKSALCLQKRIEAHVIMRDGEYPAHGFFSARSQKKEKLNLLEPLKKKYKEQLSETDEKGLRAQYYVEMVFIIKAIKELAADAKCFFDVRSIMERTKEEMEGDEGSWEWISVHTE